MRVTSLPPISTARLVNSGLNIIANTSVLLNSFPLERLDRNISNQSSHGFIGTGIGYFQPFQLDFKLFDFFLLLEIFFSDLGSIKDAKNVKWV